LLDIQTKKITDLTPESPYLHIHASWSPDGKWISFSSFVDPWWAMFKNTEWKVYIMDVNDKQHAEVNIGKGFQSQWVDNNSFVISYNRLFKVYDIQTRTVVKEFKIDDPCYSDYSIGRTIDTIYYKAFCGGEGERPVIKIFDLKSRKKKELIPDGEYPIYIK
jgi:hypothetical protein